MRRRAAVLGSPVGHSLSPVLHTAAYAALGLDDWSYSAIECDGAHLPTLLDSLDERWAGLSLTMPLKRAVLPLLDHADDLVSEVGAANTVVFRHGARYGYNTDVVGLVAALAGAGVTAVGEPIVLGAGATACAALAALRELGATKAAVAARNPTRAADLVAAAGRLGVAVTLISLAGADPAGWSFLVSALPSGAADIYAERLAQTTAAPHVIVDVAYDPWPTGLAEAGRSVGAVVIGGFEMLLYQAAAQVELMTGLVAPVAAMRTAGSSALAARSRRSGNTQSRRNALLWGDD